MLEENKIMTKAYGEVNGWKNEKIRWSVILTMCYWNFGLFIEIIETFIQTYFSVLVWLFVVYYLFIRSVAFLKHIQFLLRKVLVNPLLVRIKL